MKNVLITGVSRGMGLATAKALVNEGYAVYGVYNTNEKEAQNLKNELGNVELFQCDLADRTQTLNLVSRLKDVQFHGIVNSAGVFVNIDFDQFDTADWEKVFEVNLLAPLLIVQGLKDQLQDGASIVNIASIDGLTGAITGIGYSASKAALINVSMSLANILSTRKIRVNTISPGWIGDGMQAPQQILDEAKVFNPLGKVGAYEDIANTVAFLLSDKAAYINGTNIVVDGGEMSTTYLLKKEAEL